MKTAKHTPNRWGYTGRLLKVRKTESKVISPGLIEASERANKRLSDVRNQPQIIAW
ncbi:hypothetical protein [Marinimicrobium sp. ABcell2]|uniref:hypothetical protein n=1 Tax=Marinimicrobium sp. ABcell2 TaxID=3069751 RepID=UPI0027B72FBB|nr:hypothetical protein [Marinimicrobium sp. ABcell2]MDQ2077444.1 hypothetical protein [Marinimicrobium sp. ABcell2]